MMQRFYPPLLLVALMLFAGCSAEPDYTQEDFISEITPVLSVILDDGNYQEIAQCMAPKIISGLSEEDLAELDAKGFQDVELTSQGYELLTTTLDSCAEH